ncbi:MAG: hypothetical protein GC159_15710 [Phycisphaera sp.]|nr:hypothetical protein [Phycisphaera sp.]
MHPFEELERVGDFGWKGAFRSDVYDDCCIQLEWDGGSRIEASTGKVPPPNGDLDLFVHDRTGTGPTAAQCRCFDWYVENARRLRGSILRLLYERLRSFPELASDVIAELSVDDVPRLIHCIGLNIFEQSEGGDSSYSLAFNCGWDPEHGVEVLLHGDSIIKFAGVGAVMR